jgi:hypothetical protein
MFKLPKIVSTRERREKSSAESEEVDKGFVRVSFGQSYRRLSLLIAGVKLQ